MLTNRPPAKNALELAADRLAIATEQLLTEPCEACEDQARNALELYSALRVKEEINVTA